MILASLFGSLFHHNILKPLQGHTISGFDKNVLQVERIVCVLIKFLRGMQEVSCQDRGRMLCMMTSCIVHCPLDNNAGLAAPTPSTQYS